MAATLGLRPKKYAWYTACFVVLLLSLFGKFLEQLLNQPSATGNWIEVVEMVAYAVGHSIAILVVLIFPLALLFFFDGWFSKTIVGVVLASMTVTQAVELGNAVRGYVLASDSRSRPEPRRPADALEAELKADAPAPVMAPSKRKRSRHVAPAPLATPR